MTSIRFKYEITNLQLEEDLKDLSIKFIKKK